jgi:hypothetical protein
MIRIVEKIYTIEEKKEEIEKELINLLIESMKKKRKCKRKFC